MTGVQGSEGSSVIEGATVIGQAVLQVIVVEGKRRRNLDIVWVVAGPTLLDWATVGATGSTSPVQRRLQGCVLRVVLRHAPQFHAHAAVWDRRAGE